MPSGFTGTTSFSRPTPAGAKKPAPTTGPVDRVRGSDRPLILEVRRRAPYTLVGCAAQAQERGTGAIRDLFVVAKVNGLKAFDPSAATVDIRPAERPLIGRERIIWRLQQRATLHGRGSLILRRNAPLGEETSSRILRRSVRQPMH